MNLSGQVRDGMRLIGRSAMKILPPSYNLRDRGNFVGLAENYDGLTSSDGEVFAAWELNVVKKRYQNGI